MPTGRPSERSASLAVAILAVQPIGIGGRTGDAIAFAKPLQQVAILAAATAEWRVIR